MTQKQLLEKTKSDLTKVSDKVLSNSIDYHIQLLSDQIKKLQDLQKDLIVVRDRLRR